MAQRRTLGLSAGFAGLGVSAGGFQPAMAQCILYRFAAMLAGFRLGAGCVRVIMALGAAGIGDRVVRIATLTFCSLGTVSSAGCVIVGYIVHKTVAQISSLNSTTALAGLGIRASCVCIIVLALTAGQGKAANQNQKHSQTYFFHNDNLLVFR